MAKSLGMFGTLVDVMGYPVLAECDHPRGHVSLRMRADGQIHVGEITLPLAYKHLNAMLRGNPLASTMFQAHASRWVSDVIARLGNRPDIKPQEVPPACLFKVRGLQIAVVPDVDVNSSGQATPTIALRTYEKNRNQFISRTQSFDAGEAGFKQRDTVFEKVWASKSVAPVSELWGALLKAIDVANAEYEERLEG